MAHSIRHTVGEITAKPSYVIMNTTHHKYRNIQQRSILVRHRVGKLVSEDFGGDACAYVDHGATYIRSSPSTWRNHGYLVWTAEVKRRLLHEQKTRIECQRHRSKSINRALFY